MYKFFKIIRVFCITTVLIITNLYSIKGQSGPGGVDNIETNSLLKLWLDAGHVLPGDSMSQGNGIKILGISDRSGKGNNVAIAGTDFKPYVLKNDSIFNGLSFMRFSLNKEPNFKSGLIVNNFFKSQDFTFYIVLQIPQTGSFRKNEILPLFSFNQTIEDNGGVVNNGLKNISLFLKNNHIFFSADEKKLHQHQVSLPVTAGNQYIVRASSAGVNGSLEIAFNNGAVNRIITSRPVINSISNLLIGYDEKSPNAFPGKIASFITFARLLTHFEQFQIENFLSSKYNIPLSKNDLYLMDTTVTGDFDYEVAGIGMAANGIVAKEARGEGLIEIRNPSDLDLNESLFWGRNIVPLQQLDSIDIPQGSSFRLSTSWAVTEFGDLGAVDMAIDSSLFKNSSRYQKYMVIDKNMNGTFADDSIIVFPKAPNAKFLTIKNIQLNDRERFTFGGILDIGQWTTGLITPDGDGTEDSFYIPRRGMVKIRDGNGFLVRELKAPGEWNGTNNDGQLVAPGRYQLEINETDRFDVLIRY